MAPPPPPPPPRSHSPDRPDGVHGGCAGARRGDGIPVVDFGALASGAAEQRSRAVRDLGRACEDWGFFMVINHGVPEALREAVMDACKELFRLPRKEKAAYMNGGPMDPVRMGAGFFYSVADGAVCGRDFVKMFAHPELHCPAKPANLRDIAMEYSACTRHLMLELTKAISESLGLEGGRLSEAMDLGSCFQMLVGNHYPPSDGIAAMGMPGHSDHGLLTLLFQNGVDGLQVKHNGQWLLAKPLPGAFFVIAGDQLEIVTNGRYKGALHRAMINGEQARVSFVSLIGPSLDAVVEPVPELAQGDRCPEFQGVRYRDYLEHQQSTALNEKKALDIARVRRDELTSEGALNSSGFQNEADMQV